MNTIDMGQGSDTAMSQIAAQTLEIPLSQVKVVRADTAVKPSVMGTLGSRSTFHMAMRCNSPRKMLATRLTRWRLS
ncbi:molybdopterin cofactor-binding domain-containing protein [Variovorax sp. RT4R15]|uniref:molybdopterin cofactor-binding domain-containing protein n=1 Tax=Variovorax sp. RT4R15 TaxID=3443737 RepID=UPI003F44F1A3